MNDKEEPHNPKYVLADVCDVRFKHLDDKIKWVLGTSLLTITLIVIELFRGFV